VVLTVGLTYLIVDAGFKELTWRARPFDVLPDIQVITTRPVTSSFPSVLAACALGGALATARVLPAARLVWFGLAALIAYSRVYTGVHFPTDVLAGAALGTLCAVFVLGGRHPATSQSGLLRLLDGGAGVRP
jgi:undecaprenyl-diphosphatase